MKKDLDWLKAEAVEYKRLIKEYGHRDDKEAMIRAVDAISEKISQVVEPEVLTDKWIDDNSVYASSDGITEEYVHVDVLKEILVPKQEEVKEGRVRLIVGFDGGTDSYYATDVEDALDFLTDYDARFTVNKEPLIPRFVAEWYESEGKRNSWWNWFYKWGRDEGRTELETKTIRWMQDFNEELFVDMFRYGYEVEEEQKYRVMDKNVTLLGKVDGKIFTTAEIMEYYPEYESFGFKLTEQEIKDYDPRYWAFAKPVKELEE